MEVVVETRAICLIGSSATADRLAQALTDRGTKVKRLATACFPGRPPRQSDLDA